MLDRDDRKELVKFMGLFWTFWLKVNGEDLSEPIEYQVEGRSVLMTELEWTMLNLFHDKALVQIAKRGDEIVGFVLYHLLLDCIVLIRHNWVEEEYRSHNLSFSMVNSISKDIKKVIFQTRKENPPTELLEKTSKFRSKVYENEKLITWEMNWGGMNGTV